MKTIKRRTLEETKTVLDMNGIKYKVVTFSNNDGFAIVALGDSTYFDINGNGIKG